MSDHMQKKGFDGKQFVLWLGAMILGGVLGALRIEALNEFCNFIASIYSRLFQCIAVPTIALAVLTTLATLGAGKNSRRIFLRTILWTVLTTVAAALVGAVLYKVIGPGNLQLASVQAGQESVSAGAEKLTVYGHILSVIPRNVIAPIASGNVLSILLMSAAAGLAIAYLKTSENVQTLLKGLLGVQEILFVLIRALVWTLPLGIVAFSAQLAAQMSAGVMVGSMAKYTAVVLGGNLIQFFIILPLFLICRGLNPLKVFRSMLPAVLMALFTKSSAATLPVTVASAETRLKARPEVARFVLPVCCTINMNGCAAFILVTSLFVMQNGGTVLNWPVILLWLLISVVAAIGNAGVPMGCYFLTLSLMAGTGAPVAVMGLILPLYAVIDMVETAVNVWSDSCVCAMVDRDLDA
ncbi:MAG: dicarboxylate/amino acid:cation symporter [Lentisphaeria bacterium]|nr:dicarboxylate/amino acid:cation symporter [Lentisphaeria bacterium]